MEGFKMAHYGENREVNATEEELKMFQIICELLPDDKIFLVRRSDNYVTAAIGPNDIARFKFTPRAKWIQLPYVLKDKVKIACPDDIRELKEDLQKALDFVKSI